MSPQEILLRDREFYGRPTDHLIFDLYSYPQGSSYVVNSLGIEIDLYSPGHSVILNEWLEPFTDYREVFNAL
jgi:hypothetical protein